MPTIYNPNKRKGLFFIPSGAIKSESAAFSYSQGSYRVDESNPTPTITGDTGGTFTATPEGLTLNSSTGEITLSSSVVSSYVVTYTLPSGTFENRSLGITAAAFASTQSFEFDGVDDYFDLGSTSALDFQTSEMSISFWINSDTASGLKAILGNTNSSASSYQYLIDIHRTVGKISFLTSGPPILTSSLTININTWYHVCITKSGTTSNWIYTMYINGSSSDGGTLSTTTNPPANQTTAIGRYGALSGYYFSGKLDELAYWNSALSSAAVTEIWNSGVPNDLDELTNASDPTVWYRMGE